MALILVLINIFVGNSVQQEKYQKEGSADELIEQASIEKHSLTRIKLLKKALSIDPYNWRGLYNLAFTYQSQGNFIDGSRTFQECLKLKPEDSLTHLNLGRCLSNIKPMARMRLYTARYHLVYFIEKSESNKDMEKVRSQTIEEIAEIESFLSLDFRLGAWPSEEEIVQKLLLTDLRGESLYAKNRVCLSVFFQERSVELDERSSSVLNKIVHIMNKDLPGIKIIIEGHTDSRELKTIRARQKLSVQRARTVRDYLVVNGVDEERLTIKGYADRYPIAENNSDKRIRLNRRVEFLNSRIGIPLLKAPN